MKRREYEKEHNGHTIPFIIEQFDSFSELVEVCDKRTRNFSNGGSADEDGTYDDPQWVGCKSLQEAKNLLKYGWHDAKKVKYMKDKVNDLSKTHDAEKIGFKNDIVGFAPIVPNAIVGIPQSMVNIIHKPKKSKVVSIIADMGASAIVSSSEYLGWGAKLIAKIVQLEKSGFRVRLEYSDTFAREGQKVHSYRVLMKSENQPFDIKRYMFPLAHVAMFRAIGFDWYERLPNAVELSGYGRPLHCLESKEFIKKEICNSDSCYHISFKSDIDEELKDVK